MGPAVLRKPQDPMLSAGLDESHTLSCGQSWTYLPGLPEASSDYRLVCGQDWEVSVPFG